MAQRSLGIVGAGQLAQMLVQAAGRRKYPLSLNVLAGSDSDPAVLAGARPFVGDFKQASQIVPFLESSDVVIFENEFFPEAFENLAVEHQTKKGGPLFVPSLQTLKELRNKLSQKMLLKDCGIPTSDFLVWDSGTENDFLRQCEEKFGRDFVLKWALGGYDGKGVLLPNSQNDPLEFLRTAKVRSLPVYAERKISFVSEWAVIAVRSLAGEMVFFPFVHSEQRDGICFEVRSSKDPRRDEAFEEVRSWIRQIASKVSLLGSFGVELFLDRDGKFWINELAPRVHNSGHYTQEAFVEDQFDCHLRAALGEKVEPPRETFPYWGMVNLLGPQGSSGLARMPTWNPSPGLCLHWYDKKEIRAGRKMGHLNWVATSEWEARTNRQRALDWVREWERAVTNG